MYLYIFTCGVFCVCMCNSVYCTHASAIPILVLCVFLDQSPLHLLRQSLAEHVTIVADLACPGDSPSQPSEYWDYRQSLYLPGIYVGLGI